MNLTANILSLLAANCTSNGGYSDELLAAIHGAEGETIEHGADLEIDNPDYPTVLRLRTTANRGDVIEVVYWTDRRTPNQREHSAGKVYVNAV